MGFAIEFQLNIWADCVSPKRYVDTPNSTTSVLVSLLDSKYSIKDTPAAVDPFGVCAFLLDIYKFICV